MEKKKYIIELEDNNLAYAAIIIDGMPYIKPLQLLPCTVPEQIRMEAYDEGFNAGRTLNTGKYEKGFNDVWEAAKKIAGMTLEEQEKIFGTVTLRDIISKFTASEAIEKLKAYEQEKIRVGNEVKCIRAGWMAIVTRIREDGRLTLMGNDGALADGYDEKDFIKTGRDFPEIAEVLQKMRKES